MGRLDQKVAIVTGAGSGIGYAITKAYVAEGARVIAVDIGEESRRLEQEFGASVRVVIADVSKETSIAAMVAEAIDHFERVDILVNNAGISGPIVRLHELTTESFTRTFGINLMGQFFTMKHLIPHFLEHGGGTIVNMASLSAYPPFTAGADYSASKAAVKRLTECVAYEYAADGIRANAIAPGHIETPIYRGLEDHKAVMATRIPLGRFGEPEEVARIAVVLASEDTSYVTGQTIVVDGGRALS